ncbi:hypothetical protein [Cohaesibacter celericrescens]|uniref:Flagellar assembly protein FliH/Type III secretion system HrpE domain-containing protein n=1 Tax=Cohaesibacter celericrescens TaxID=2067669 RepID=A0A2N5XWP0_9HYPH|nr:hypothetical protein [Cohaesibacter celericrescens]PLW75514.1 hypothetical protein C0081_19440 [Cohaesibacter celericrescens]PLW78921.1 hypothetical protein C0081_01400 [Cohaesibacter celericrescens]
MASALKDLLPLVDETPVLPSASTQKKHPERVLFGGLDILFQKAHREEQATLKMDEQSLRTQAWSQGLSDAETLWNEKQEHEREAARRALQQEKDELADLLYESLTGHIEHQFEEIKTALADQLAELLEPLMAEQGRKVMVARFAEVAASALNESVAQTPMLKGSKELLQQLSTCCQNAKVDALARDQLAIDELSKDDPTKALLPQKNELSLQLDKTVFETRLTAYLAQLREAVQHG